MTRFINPDDGLYGYWPTTTPQAYQNNVVPVWHGASPQRYVSPDPTANFYGLGAGEALSVADSRGSGFAKMLANLQVHALGSSGNQAVDAVNQAAEREKMVLRLKIMLGIAAASGLGLGLVVGVGATWLLTRKRGRR